MQTLPTEIAENDLNRAFRLLAFISVLGWTWSAVAAATAAGPWSAWVCIAVTTSVYLGTMRWRSHDPLARLAVFGLSAGLVALTADWWLVEKTKTLVFPEWGPSLGNSPAYMPASWTGMIVTAGFAGWLVKRRYGTLPGVLCASVFAGVVIPLLEMCAHFAGWWSYRDTPSIAGVPHYIILGELLIGAPLPLLVSRVLSTGRVLEWIGLGTIAGGWIWAAYALAYAVVG